MLVKNCARDYMQIHFCGLLFPVDHLTCTHVTEFWSVYFHQIYCSDFLFSFSFINFLFIKDGDYWAFMLGFILFWVIGGDFCLVKRSRPRQFSGHWCPIILENCRTKCFQDEKLVIWIFLLYVFMCLLRSDTCFGSQNTPNALTAEALLEPNWKAYSAPLDPLADVRGGMWKGRKE